MHSASTFNAFVSFVPPESAGLFVCEIPQVLKAQATRSLLAGLEAQLGFEPVRLFDSLLQDYLDINLYHVQRLAFFWLENEAAAGEQAVVTVPATAPARAAPAPVPAETSAASTTSGIEDDNRETGFILQLNGFNRTKLTKTLAALPGIEEVKLPGGTEAGALPALSYYHDKSFNVSFYMHDDYLFFSDSSACLEKLLTRYRALALAIQHQRGRLPAESKQISLFSAPEFGAAVNSKPVKLFIKPAGINRILHNLAKQSADRLLPPVTASQPTTDEKTTMAFVPLPISTTSMAASLTMLGFGLNLAGNPGLDICFLYAEKQEQNKAAASEAAGQTLLDQASLINSLGRENYMNIQKALSKPSYVFKRKSVQVQGSISQDIIPRANQYLVTTLLKLFPYQYYFDATLQSR